MNSSLFCLKQIVGIIFGMLFLLTSAQAASFDCGKAASKVEKIICAEPDLSQFDESLSMIYQKTLGTVRNPAELKRKQVTWMREVRNLCTDRACLEKVYRNRLAGLAELLVVTAADEESDCATTGSEDFPEQGVLVFLNDHGVYHVEDGDSEAADELLVWNKNTKGICFSISTVNNYHTCSLDGKATAVGNNKYSYIRDTCHVIFIFTEHEVQVKVTGLDEWGGNVCKPEGCGMNAAIYTAIYKKSNKVFKRGY